jgi:transposase-like protein
MLGGSCLRYQGLPAFYLVTGDAGLGLCSVLTEVFPDSYQQHCWMPKIKYVKRHLPKAKHGQAGNDIKNIYFFETRAQAIKRIELFKRVYRAKYPQL